MLYVIETMTNEEDREFMEEVWYEHRVAIFRRALSILHKICDAEDAVSITMYFACKHVDKIRETSPAERRYLLLTAVKNVSFRLYRKNNKLPCPEDEEFFNSLKVSVNMEEVLVNKVYCEELLSKLKTLPKDYCDILILKYHFGYKSREIAEIMNVSTLSIKSKIHRAKNMLRKNISEYLEENTNFKKGEYSYEK